MFRLAIPAPRAERQRFGRLVQHLERAPRAPEQAPILGDGLVDTDPHSVVLSVSNVAGMMHTDAAAFLTGARDHLEAYDPRESRTHQRLADLGWAVRPFNYDDDPRYPHWMRQLGLLDHTDPRAPLDGPTQDLWDWLLAVQRQDRANDGEFIPEHLVAVCRIANEIRRRLLGEPTEEAPDDAR